MEDFMKKKTWYDLFAFVVDLLLTAIVVYLLFQRRYVQGLSLLALKAIVFIITRVIRTGKKEDEEVEPSEDDISEEV